MFKIYDCDKVLSFVNMYKNTPWLWDVKHVHYKDKFKKKETLADLGAKFGMTGDEVDRKINCLRTQYRREKKKQSSKWFAYDAMRFLDVLDNKNPQFSNNESYEETTPDFEPEYYDDASDNAEDLSKEDVQILTQHIRPHCPPNIPVDVIPCPQELSRKRCFSNEDIQNEDRTKRQRTSDSMVFGNYIGLRLEKMDEYVRAVVVHKISDILFQADMGMLDRQNFNPKGEEVPSTSQPTRRN